VRRLVKRLHRWLRHRDSPAILMYHRIATPDVDPWGLSVSPERFAEQVHALRARRTILSMDAFVARLRSGDLPHDAVALTFDDGYLDNLRRAKPILEAAEIPATVFLTTGRIGTGKEFWWDELARMVLCRAEPLSASVTVEADDLQINLPPIDPMEPHINWRAWLRPKTAREAAYQTLWRSLQDCAPGHRERAMTRLRRVFGVRRPNPADLPMRAADVRKLVSDRVSVGAHGCTHQSLIALPASARVEEIQRSRAEAEALSALPVTGFAYPHGDRDGETIDMVRQAGYRWACSTHEANVDPQRANLHDLPRIAVGDWRAKMLLVKLDASAHDRSFRESDDGH
jgi:peptidoglycan/xylan/chitin deacetylase (PgdA/CDA1 family)